MLMYAKCSNCCMWYFKHPRPDYCPRCDVRLNSVPSMCDGVRWSRADVGLSPIPGALNCGPTGTSLDYVWNEVGQRVYWVTCAVCGRGNWSDTKHLCAETGAGRELRRLATLDKLRSHSCPVCHFMLFKDGYCPKGHGPWPRNERTLGDLGVGEDAWTLHWAFASTYPAYPGHEPNTMTMHVRRVYGGFIKVWCNGMPGCKKGEFVRFSDNHDFVDAVPDAPKDKWDRTKEKLAKAKIDEALRLTRDAVVLQKRARGLAAKARYLTRVARELLA